jgi:Domain of unknown function (DUF5615)
MIGRLLIDECLSPELVQLAIDAGHVDSTCVRDRGRLGLKDWELMEYVIQQDFILVTRNAQDFRGAGQANPGGLHASAEVHAGLICLDSALEMDIDLQQELFKYALNTVAELPDLINQALEVFENEDGLISVNLYDIPPLRS